jgi:hypothetical protein
MESIDSKNDNKVDIIMRQTDYTKEKALEKLEQFDFDEIRVIKDYFGIGSCITIWKLNLLILLFILFTAEQVSLIVIFEQVIGYGCKIT